MNAELDNSLKDFKKNISEGSVNKFVIFCLLSVGIISFIIDYFSHNLSLLDVSIFCFMVLMPFYLLLTQSFFEKSKIYIVSFLAIEVIMLFGIDYYLELDSLLLFYSAIFILVVLLPSYLFSYDLRVIFLPLYKMFSNNDNSQLSSDKEKIVKDKSKKMNENNKLNTTIPEPEIFAKGVNGQIELYSKKICISREGVLGFITQGLKGDKNIMISTVTSIQFKNATSVINGYIQFSFMGSQEAKGGILEGTHDENTVMFNKEQQPFFEEIRNIVEQRIHAHNAPMTAISDADELKKYADLRDKGILNEKEFQEKKKQILGL